MSQTIELAYEMDQEAQWYEEQAGMSAAEEAQMLDELFQRDVIQEPETERPDYLQEAFLLVEGEIFIEVTREHLQALSRYFGAKLSLKGF